MKNDIKINFIHPEQIVEKLHFLAGGGEMSRLIKEMDWKRTSLGPPENWPQSLKTAVSIVLRSPVPLVMLWGPDGIMIYNDAYSVFAGVRHPSLLGSKVLDGWPEVADFNRNVMEQGLKGKTLSYQDQELILLRNNLPEEVAMDLNYSPIADESGQPAGVLSIVVETTDRVINQRQLFLLRELAAKTVDAKTIQHVCDLSIQTLDLNDKDIPFALLYLADTDKKVFTLSGSTRMKKGHAAAPESIPFEDESLWPLARVLEDKEIRLVDDLDKTFQYLPKGFWKEPPRQAAIVPITKSGQTGKAGVLIIGLNPFRTYNQGYEGFIWLIAGQIASGIASAQAYEEERRRAEALAEIDRAKTLFFSNVSHEFRTPLTLMLGPVHDMLDLPIDDGYRENLEMIRRNGIRLQKLVNTLLDFSRIEAGRVTARYVATDLSDFTAGLASNFRSAIEKAGMKLIVTTPKLSGEVYVDREMWEKIILNLLSNAFKFTFEGEIEVSLKEDATHVTLQVKDTGEGIPEKDLPGIFERFKRVEGAKSRSYEGSGIGLSLVQELVRLHGGVLNVESVVGKGTTFAIEIPKGTHHLPQDQIDTETPTPVALSEYFVEEAELWIAEAETKDNVPAGQSEQLLPGFTYKPKIVLADDNADMRNYMRRLLAGRFEVKTAQNGKEALKIILKENPDLVLSDVMMPEMDGFSLLAILKGSPHTSHIPVIMLSARAGEEATVEGLEAGADDYLVKPFSSVELLARASTVIAASKGRRETEERLFQLFKQAPAAIVILQGEKHLVALVNPIALMIWGRKYEQVINQPLFEALPEIRGQGLEELLEQVRTSGEPYYGNERKVQLERHGTLEDVYFTFVYTPLRTAKDKIDGVMVFAYEVTSQVHARKKIEDSEEALKAKVGQQAVVTELGLLALSGASLKAVMNEAVEKLQKILAVEYTKVLELLPDGKEAILRAGVGWDKTIVIDKSTVDTGKNSQAGYTLSAKEPVIVEDLRTEKRYSGPPLLNNHKVISGMSCIIWGRNNQPYGVLGAHTTRKKTFTSDDIIFLQAIANILATAIQRKKDEEELRYYATTMQNMADAVISTDLDHRIISWNESAEKLYGWGRDEVIGKKDTEVIPTRYSEAESPADWKDALATQGFWTGEVIQKRRDGSSVPVLSSVSYVRDLQGRPIGAVAVNLDITQRKLAENALRSSEERYRKLFNSIDEGFCIIEVLFNDEKKAVDYRFVEVNPTFERQTGIKNAQGRRMREIALHHEEHWFETYGKVALTGEPRRFENHAKELNRFFDVYAFSIGDAGRNQIALIFNDITERRLAEQALRKSEEYYKTMTDNTPVMTWIRNSEGSYIFINRQWYEYTGHSPARALGSGWLEAVHPEDIENSKKAFSAAQNQRVPYTMEFRLKDKKGNYRWHLDSGLPKFETNGEFEGYVGAVIDIHERKVAEDRLQESESKFRTLADNISQLAWMTDESGWIFWYNQRWFDYTGTTLEEVKGWGWQKVHHPEHVERVTKKFKKSFENGEAWEDTFPLRGKDGTYRWFLSRAIPIRNEHGKILQWFGTNTDVTDLMETEDALKKSEEFSRTLLESSPDCVKALDLDGKLITMNNNGQRTMEIEDFSQLYGIPWTDLWIGEHHASALAAVEKARKGGIGHLQGFRPAAKGTPKWWDVLVAPVYDASGAVERLVCVSRDITELKELERQKDEFIGIASHELKTPVTSIKGSIQIIDRLLKDQSYEMVSTFLGKAELHVNKLTGLINDLLDISKIEAGKLEYNFSAFSVREIIEDAVEQVSHQAKNHVIRIEGNLDQTVYGDKVRLEQVVSNLLSNAIKYSPEANEVILSLEKEKDFVKISVTDFGIGIPKEKLPNVFERFFRVEEASHQFQGLGLGLYICAEIVRRHGGKIEAKSAKGKGSTFIFTVPAEKLPSIRREI